MAKTEKTKKWTVPKTLYGLRPIGYWDRANSHYLPDLARKPEVLLENSDEGEPLYIYTLTEIAKVKGGKLVRKTKGGK